MVSLISSTPNRNLFFHPIGDNKIDLKELEIKLEEVRKYILNSKIYEEKIRKQIEFYSKCPINIRTIIFTGCKCFGFAGSVGTLGATIFLEDDLGRKIAFGCNIPTVLADHLVKILDIFTRSIRTPLDKTILNIREDIKNLRQYKAMLKQKRQSAIKKISSISGKYNSIYEKNLSNENIIEKEGKTIIPIKGNEINKEKTKQKESKENTLQENVKKLDEIGTTPHSSKALSSSEFNQFEREIATFINTLTENTDVKELEKYILLIQQHITNFDQYSDRLKKKTKSIDRCCSGIRSPLVSVLTQVTTGSIATGSALLGLLSNDLSVKILCMVFGTGAAIIDVINDAGENLISSHESTIHKLLLAVSQYVEKLEEYHKLISYFLEIKEEDDVFEADQKVQKIMNIYEKIPSHLQDQKAPPNIISAVISRLPLGDDIKKNLQILEDSMPEQISPSLQQSMPERTYHNEVIEKGSFNEVDPQDTPATQETAKDVALRNIFELISKRFKYQPTSITYNNKKLQVPKKKVESKEDLKQSAEDKESVEIIIEK